MADGERRRIGPRYELLGKLATGGTAVVHLGRLHGPAGFTKPIAIKRLHPHLIEDPAARSLLVEEARLVSRISHPNVVAVLDVVEDEGEAFLVLEYVHGATLAELAALGGRCSPSVAVAIARDVLTGLHAAHHARDAQGEPLGLVHRDISLRNVIVTDEGVAKILDFGIARAHSRERNTSDGRVRGSLPYMAPEQLEDHALTPRTDVHAASVVLWETLTGERLFDGETDAAIVKRVLDHDVRAPSAVDASLPRVLDAVVLRGLARDPAQRFGSGLEMAAALEAGMAPASAAEVGAWVAEVARVQLESRAVLVADVEGREREVGRGDERERGRTRAPVFARALMVGVALVVAAVLARQMGLRRPGSASSTVVRPSGSASASLFAAASSGTAGASGATAAQRVAPSGASSAVDAPVVAAPVVAAPAVAAPVTITPVTTARGVAKPAVPQRGAAQVPAPRASIPRVECPPYYVDASGVRRFNRECLE